MVSVLCVVLILTSVALLSPFSGLSFLVKLLFLINVFLTFAFYNNPEAKFIFYSVVDIDR